MMIAMVKYVIIIKTSYFQPYLKKKQKIYSTHSNTYNIDYSNLSEVYISLFHNFYIGDVAVKFERKFLFVTVFCFAIPEEIYFCTDNAVEEGHKMD